MFGGELVDIKGDDTTEPEHRVLGVQVTASMAGDGSSLQVRLHDLLRFVLTKKIDDRARGSSDRDLVFEQTFVQIAGIFDRILKLQEKVKAKGIKLENRIRRAELDSKSRGQVRAMRILYWEARQEMNTLQWGFLDDLRCDTYAIMGYVKERRVESPEVDVLVDVGGIIDYMNGFPDTYSVAAELRHRKRLIKTQVARTVKSKDQESMKLREIMQKSAERIDEETGFFEEVSQEEAEFERQMMKLPTEFVVKMNTRIVHFIANPERSGDLLLEQCADLATRKRLNYETDVKYLFLLFVRMFFGQAYIKSLSTQSVGSDVFEFQRRISVLRKLTPVALGFGQKYLPVALWTVPLVDFGVDHLYVAAAAKLAQVNFQVCAIDFCKMALEGISMVQKTARELVFEQHKHTYGVIEAESDYSLALDELFDILDIVFLLSDPVDTITLVRYFDGYMTSLQLPSSLVFGFTNVRALCMHLMELDMDEFIKQAQQRVITDQEMDPLRLVS